MPQIEREVCKKYNYPQDARIGGAISYSLQYGGLVSYLSPMPGYQPTEVVVTCLERQRTLDYILARDSFSVSTVVEAALGYVPVISGISSLIFTLRLICGAVEKKSIQSAGGYTQIINTYSREFGTSASVVTGWSTHNILVTPSNSTDHKITRFPAY